MRRPTATSACEPTADDLDVLAQAVQRVTPLPRAELYAIRGALRVRELRAGEFLLRAGETAHTVVLVVRGILREYFVSAAGVERTKAFVMEGAASGSLADLVRQAPSRAFIVAEEPTRVLTVPWTALQQLEKTHPAWQHYALGFARQLLVSKAEREYELMCMDAAERYRLFRARHPGIEARIAARHVASYLSITAVHLSRLRRRARASA